ncbi:MAG: DUF359 domain-containing protein [Candidatus Hydrothermarchaeaceae archaeon]
MKDLTISEEIRPLLKRPFGEVFSGEDLKPAEDIKKELKGEKVIVVGDVTLENILAVGIKPSLAIIDLKTKRKIKENSAFKGKAVTVKNPPGMITTKLWDKIHEAMEEKGSLIVVDGEEDMAVLPCILDADWDSVVLYGQPDEGIVLVRVTEEKKFDAGTIVKMIMDQDKWKVNREEKK